MGYGVYQIGEVLAHCCVDRAVSVTRCFIEVSSFRQLGVTESPLALPQLRCGATEAEHQEGVLVGVGDNRVRLESLDGLRREVQIDRAVVVGADVSSHRGLTSWPLFSALPTMGPSASNVRTRLASSSFIIASGYLTTSG